MAVITKTIYLSTKGAGDIIDITDKVKEAVAQTREIANGIVNVFIPGATGALTTIEYEPDLLKDFKSALETLLPKDRTYFHNRSHFDRNAHSHLRASLLGPSLTIPFIDKKLQLGAWQQVVFIDFDTRPREREIILQIIGE